MLGKRIATYSRSTLRCFSENNKLFGPNKSQVPKFDPIEFTPFKFQNEKNKYFAGHTLAELFGQRVLYAHSPIVQKEMMKDNVLFCVYLVLAIFVADNARKIVWEYEDAFKEYQRAKLSYNKFRGGEQDQS
jgi:hypothetical protein